MFSAEMLILQVPNGHPLPVLLGFDIGHSASPVKGVVTLTCNSCGVFLHHAGALSVEI